MFFFSKIHSLLSSERQTMLTWRERVFKINLYNGFEHVWRFCFLDVTVLRFFKILIGNTVLKRASCLNTNKTIEPLFILPIQVNNYTMTACSGNKLGGDIDAQTRDRERCMVSRVQLVSNLMAVSPWPPPRSLSHRAQCSTYTVQQNSVHVQPLHSSVVSASTLRNTSTVVCCVCGGWRGKAKHLQQGWQNNTTILSP